MKNWLATRKNWLAKYKLDIALFTLGAVIVNWLHHYETGEDVFPVLFNALICCIYISLAMVIKDKGYLKMFLIGCAGIHGLLAYWNLSHETSEIHRWHLMLLFDWMQIYGGIRYFIYAYHKRLSFIRVQFGKDE